MNKQSTQSGAGHDDEAPRSTSPESASNEEASRAALDVECRARRPRWGKALITAAVVVVAVVSACVVYEDHCLGVACGTGEVCIDLAAGPRCVCDDFHETTKDGCVPFEEGSEG